MNSCQVANVLIYGVGPSLDRRSSEVVSGAVGEIFDLRGVPRVRIVIDSSGRKRLEYAEGSFWALPPVDLGDVQSKRLDDFIYG